jgi:1-acyl-sn-glycerol-3-phosphate acyltransferase
MGSMRLGAAQLCVTRGVPCIPIVLRGTYAAMPRGRNWPIPGRPRVAVRYGTPLVPTEGEGARGFQQRMAASVAQLWNEEELGWYQSLRLAADGPVALPTGPKGADWRRHWESTRPLRPAIPARAWREE